MRAAFFATCLVEAFFPRVGLAAVDVLERLGVDVDVPEGPACCGQPAYNSGYVEEAKAAARALLDALESADAVVLPSGSCAGMIRHHYPTLFEDEPEERARAERLAAKTYEWTEWIVDVLGVTDAGAAFPHAVTYHPSCHARRLLGLKDQPERLLDAVKGLRRLPLPYAEDCCGFGGTFAVKMSDVSLAMAEEKSAHAAGSGADVLVSTDVGCLMHIGGYMQKAGIRMRTMHIAEILAQTGKGGAS